MDLADQNVRYVEVSFSATRGLHLGISFDEILAAINTAKQRIVNKRAIRVGLIVALGRECDAHIAAEFARKAADAKKDGVVGLDLHGDETAAPPEQFAEAFEIARHAGLGLRAHAGEGAGAPSIWGAIRFLGVSRIAHGIRAIEDAALIEYLRHHPITLDVCPTSNLKLGIVSSLSVHPIRRLFDLGIRVTVNSDDPLFFNTTISEEYQALRQHLGFTSGELKQVTLYAVEGAFLSDEERATLRREIEYDFVTEERNDE
jgi:adenosine deaminase